MKCCKDTDCTPRMMKQAFFALKRGDWEEYTNIFRVQAKATEWAFDGIQEVFEKVVKDKRSCQEVQITRGASSRQQGQGGVTMSYLCPHCNSFPLEDYVLVGFSWEEAHELVVCDLRNQAIVPIRPRSLKRMRYRRACVKT